MFRIDYRKEEDKLREKELMNNVKLNEKPKFKDLVSLMIAQYLIILPIAFIGIIAFMLIAKLILSFWGA